VKYYSEGFKKAALQKVLLKGNRTTSEITNELGISLSTIYKWRDKFSNVEPMKKKTSPQHRTVDEKLKALTEYSALSESLQGEYLRKNGLHKEHLIEWKQQIVDAFSPQKKVINDNKELLEAKTKVRNLEREIHRKDKALAEAAALLILKKKADLLWGSEEDE